MTTLWSAYQKFVLPDVPQCPAPLCVDAIRAAATEFLQITRFWHVATLAQAVAAATTPRNVPITIPGGGKAWAPIWVNWHPASSTTDMVELTSKSSQDMDALVPNWRASLDTRSTPAYYTMRGEASLVLGPWPAADGTVDYDFSFVPTASSTGCIDDLFDLFYETVAIGAIARLLMKPKQPWSDMNEGSGLMKLFELKCADAAVREDRGRTPAIITTRTEYR